MSKEKLVEIKQISYLKDFKCIADKCPDTCCSQWTINITSDNKEFYESKNLKINQDIESHSDGHFKMKRDDSGGCVQLDGGLCKVQRDFGETYLPDVCYTFPRSYKKIFGNTYVAANLSCPESLRVALYSNKSNDFSSWDDVTQSRAKSILHDSKFGETNNLSESQTINALNSVTRMIGDKDFSADQSMARFLFLAANMDDNFDYSSIDSEIEKITKNKVLEVAHKNLAEIDLRSEMTNVLKGMFDLVNRDRPRYNDVIKMVKEILGDNHSDQSYVINNYENIYNSWQEHKHNFDSILKNLTKAQISYMTFPIAGPFYRRYDEAVVILLEYVVIKLALMCKSYELNGKLDQQDVVDLIQPIAKRFYVRRKQELLNFCNNVGWSDFKKTIAIIINF